MPELVEDGVWKLAGDWVAQAREERVDVDGRVGDDAGRAGGRDRAIDRNGKGGAVEDAECVGGRGADEGLVVAEEPLEKRSVLEGAEEAEEVDAAGEQHGVALAAYSFAQDRRSGMRVEAVRGK